MKRKLVFNFIMTLINDYCSEEVFFHSKISLIRVIDLQNYQDLAFYSYLRRSTYDFAK